MTTVFHPDQVWPAPLPDIWRALGWLLILIGVIVLITLPGAGLLVVLVGVIVIRHARKPRRFGGTIWTFRAIH
ncbi:hypothetical protein [Hyphobacterium sp.]|uniref:hypothetical protein n=1 Tax=Hyphobacterium sp. TaxID=2004662 RepID=UPI00374A2296